MKKLNITIFAFVLTLVGCATTPDASMRPFVGMSKTDLISSWGSPTSKESDGKNGEIWIYEDIRYQARGRSYEIEKGIKTFYIDGNGIITNYKWSERSGS